MKLLFTILLFPLFSLAQTANDFPLANFQTPYSFSSNTGYYGTASNFNNDSLSKLQYNAGCRNLRISMPDFFISQFGSGAFDADIAAYLANGFTGDFTVFLGGVYADNRINHTFPTCDSPSYMWRGMYNPIYTDSTNTQIDTSNTFANYVYKTVNHYKNYVKTWEIINEALLCSGNANSRPSNTDYWLTNPPIAGQLPNILSPVYYYIRALRIAWTVIKTEDPTAHIATGGMITWEEADVLSRYTDNPGSGDISGAGSGVAGSVTANFPLSGSAYFDVQDMHIYSMFSKNTFDNNVDFYGNYASHANSDYSLYIYQSQVHGFDSAFWSNGYNGVTYPKKYKIITEMDCPKTTAYGFYGSDSLNVNFLMKAHLKSRQDTILNNYKFALGDITNTGEYFSNMGLYKNLELSGLTVANAPKDSGYWGNKTLDTLLDNSDYSPSITASLSLPSDIDGVAFKDSTNTTVLSLWAITTGFQNEAASGNYTLPTGTWKRYAWNYSRTNSTSNVSGNVSLDGTVSFFRLISTPTHGCCKCRRRH